MPCRQTPLLSANSFFTAMQHLFLRTLGLAMAVGILPLAASAQVGLGTTTPDAKAVLDLTATNKGLLIPRLTQAQRLAIPSPPQGLMVYQTDGTASGGAQTGFWYYAGTPASWVFLNPAAAGDNLGNHTATQKLDLATFPLVGNGGTSGISISSGGNVGIGTSSPQGRLDVASGAVRLPGGGGSDTWFNYFGDNKNYLRGTTVLADLGGSVGIGTSTPGATLDVPSGSVHLPGDSWIRYSGNNKNYLRGTTILADDAQGGNVGIGTANPTQRLEVSGQVYSSTGGFRFPDNSVQTTAAPTPSVSAASGTRISAM